MAMIAQAAVPAAATNGAGRYCDVTDRMLPGSPRKCSEGICPCSRPTAADVLRSSVCRVNRSPVRSMPRVPRPAGNSRLVVLSVSRPVLRADFLPICNSLMP